MKNYIINMFSILKNGQMAYRAFVYIQKKKSCENYLKILWKEGFILGYNVENNRIKIILKYVNEKPVINSLILISKPGRKIYYSIKQIWKFDSTKTFLIFSTNQGLKTLTDCKKHKIGGEPILLIN